MRTRRSPRCRPCAARAARSSTSSWRSRNSVEVEATRRLEIYADGALVDARDLTIPAGQRSEAMISTVPRQRGAVEARLAGDDALAADDRAFAIVPAEGRTRALLVGEGNAYLENALALLPRLELYAVSEAGYDDALAEAADDGTRTGSSSSTASCRPNRRPARRSTSTLHADGAFGTVAGRIDGPLIDRTDPEEPLLRFVDLTTRPHRSRTRGRPRRGNAHRWSPRGAGDPLVAVGERDGRRVAVIGFDLGESDLPLQVAFPLLMSNLVDHLLPAAEGILPSSMPLGESVSVNRRPEHRARRRRDHRRPMAREPRSR